MQQIQALRFDVEEVGKHVKGSKKRFTWDVSLKDKHHTIILDFSFISGKVKITVDRKVLLQNELPSNVSFQYPFTLEGFALNVIQQGETFELRINNKVFSHLYTQHKTNTEFKRYEDEVKDIKVNLNQMDPPKQKISLNIGAFGGMHKKKKDVTGGAEGWNAFQGGSFPNYFGDQAQKQPQKPKASVPKANLLDEDQKTQIETAKTENKKPESNLLGDFDQVDDVKPVSKPSSDSILDFSGPSQEPRKSDVEDFNTMQNMFSTVQVNNEMDLFASEPKKEEPSSPSSPLTPSFQFNATGSSSPNHFATGFNFEASSTNANNFATSSPSCSPPGSNPLEVDFFNLPPKQEGSVNVFSKKTTAEQKPSGQMENVFAQSTSGKSIEAKPQNSNLTDMSLNDFMSSKPKEPKGLESMNPSSNDFSTMQNLFQTNSSINPGFSVSQSNLQSRPSQMPNSSQGFNFNMSSTSPHEGEFNTMQNMFQTTNYANYGQASSTINKPVTSQPTSILSSSENKPASAFATMSGGATSSFQFDMASFGTTQPNTTKSPQGGFQFFEPKAAKTNTGSNNLI